MRGEWICRKYGNEKTPRCRMCTGEFLERGESESASTAAAKEQDDPQTGVVSAEIVAASASAAVTSAAVTSAAKTTAAAKEQDDPQTRVVSVGDSAVFASASTVRCT